MKYRQTFVSNSSSTSFVFSTHSERVVDEVTIPIVLKINLMDYVDRVIKTETDLVEYFTEQYSEQPEDSEVGVAALEALRNGEWVFFGSASDQSCPEENMLCESGIDFVEGINVIEPGGGY